MKRNARVDRVSSPVGPGAWLRVAAVALAADGLAWLVDRYISDVEG